MTRTATTTVTFIDGSLADIETLIASMEPGRTYNVIDPNRDGLVQMVSILAP